MRRVVDAIIGLVALGLVGAFVLGVLAIYQQTFVDRVRVELRTGSVGNALRVGSDVKVRGVPVGRVEKIASTDDGAVVTLAIDPDDAAEIPADSVGRLLPKTLFGERFVSLQAPATGSTTTPATDTVEATIQDGDVLEQDTSPESVELQELFDDLLPVLQAVQPEKLSAMLSEVAATLRGQGATIGDTTVLAGDYLGRLNPLVPQLADDLSALGRVADDYAGATPDLLTALDNFSSTSSTLVADQANLKATLARVTGAADAGTGFTSTNQRNIIVLSKESRRALNAVRPYAKEFPCVFSSLRAFIPQVDSALGRGTSTPGLQADVTVVAARGGGYVGSRDTPKLLARGEASCPVNTPTDKTSADESADQSDGPAVLSLSQPNSPEENRVMAELLAPGQSLAPADFPRWSSLLLGPILRGSELELR